MLIVTIRDSDIVTIRDGDIVITRHGDIMTIPVGDIVTVCHSDIVIIHHADIVTIHVGDIVTIRDGDIMTRVADIVPVMWFIFAQVTHPSLYSISSLSPALTLIKESKSNVKVSEQSPYLPMLVVILCTLVMNDVGGCYY